MYNVLSITIPFFAIIFLGTLFNFNKVFNNKSAKILTKFALYVTLPPFMFINILKAAANSNIFNWNFILRFELITLILWFSTFIVSTILLKNNKKESSIFSLNSTYPNYYNPFHYLPILVISLLSIAGIVVSDRNSYQMNFLILFFLSNVAIVSFFFILPRYKLGIIPLQIIFSNIFFENIKNNFLKHN